MGHKEEQRREMRRRLFHRDGWQDAHGDWFVMCGFGCGTVLSWATAGIRKRDADDRYVMDNTYLTCQRGCSPTKVARAAKRAEEKAQRERAERLAARVVAS